jgi:hypothetical protein
VFLPNIAALAFFSNVVNFHTKVAITVGTQTADTNQLLYLLPHSIKLSLPQQKPVTNEVSATGYL